MKVVGRYTLDTLQVFFPWDDDLYTYFRERGLGSDGLGSKKLPLIYTDNCESTAGVPERKRKNVIHPRFFGLDLEGLGWKPTDRETEPIIPAEKPELEVTLSEANNVSPLTLSITPRVRGVEQYHLEYSTMSEFGRLYTNWAAFYLPVRSAEDLMNRIGFPSGTGKDFKLYEETKQAQRERFSYFPVQIAEYSFSYESFEYAKRYFALNGVKGRLPSLVYDSSNPESRRLMEPLVKLGIIHTKRSEGFEERKPQIAIKVAQPKITMTKRNVRGKVKGIIREDAESRNLVVLHAEDFAAKLRKIYDIWKR